MYSWTFLNLWNISVLSCETFLCWCWHPQLISIHVRSFFSSTSVLRWKKVKQFTGNRRQHTRKLSIWISIRSLRVYTSIMEFFSFICSRRSDATAIYTSPISYHVSMAVQQLTHFSVNYIFSTSSKKMAVKFAWPLFVWTTLLCNICLQKQQFFQEEETQFG